MKEIKFTLGSCDRFRNMNDTVDFNFFATDECFFNLFVDCEERGKIQLDQSHRETLRLIHRTLYRHLMNFSVLYVYVTHAKKKRPSAVQKGWFYT